jgi:uncharacterized Zn finger protein (UPF0148 family)
VKLIPRWRKATWAVVLWTALFALWIGFGVSATSNNCAGKVGDELTACQAGTAIGAGIGVTFLVIVWFLGFVVLSLIWLMSRPQRRLCPVCGEQVKKGLTACPKCGYDFAAGRSTQTPSPDHRAASLGASANTLRDRLQPRGRTRGDSTGGLGLVETLELREVERLLDEHEPIEAAEVHKVRENRAQRMATRKGYQVVVVESRGRDQRAVNYGRYIIVNPDTGSVEPGIVVGEPGRHAVLTLEEVEDWLLDK